MKTIQLDETSSIGMHIKKKRFELQLKQGDVARVIGVSEDCITLWENERSKPQIQHMPKIIQFLGYCPVTYENVTIGGRIKSYRIAHGLSHKKMGMLLAVDASTIRAWESGKLSIRESNRETLDKVLTQ